MDERQRHRQYLVARVYQPTYDARAIVLRKTKLGESDLIVTLLAQDGSQARAVAKGARKPARPFAARLER